MEKENSQKLFSRNKPRYNELEEGVNIKELADRVMNLSGNAKGETIAVNLRETLEARGRDGLESLEKKMEELGYSISLQEIRKNDYYPESLNVLLNIVKKNIFSMDDEEVFLSGRNNAKLSFFAKIMTRHFISLEMVRKNAAKYWNMNMDFGEFQFVSIDKEKRELIVRVVGYNKSSISCIFQAGYYYETLISVIGKPLFIEETKCVHDGDPFHEYKVTWQ